jgi:hypothetical protein
MKHKLLLLVVSLVVALLMPPTADAQFRSLKGLGNKLKEKVKEAAKDKGKDIGNIGESVSEGNVPGVATTIARSEAPWPMSENPTYNGKDVRTFLYNIVDESDDYLTSLREEMYSRYKDNAKIIKNMGEGCYEAQSENQNLMRFYYEIQTFVHINVGNVHINNGVINANDPHLLITSRKGGGIGYWVMNKNGNFRFCTSGGDGAYLDDEDLAIAKEAALRMRKMQIITYALHVMLKEAGEQCDPDLRALYNYSGIYANAVEKACEANTPENIERKPRPKAGAMHASMKAQALAVAKANDSDVVDVIITSASWDVKMRGLIPVNRNIYGYYIVKDEHGLMCLPRMWTQDYNNGKYGKLRAGGTGTESPFYIK